MLGVACFAVGALLGALLTHGTPAAWADFRGTATSSVQLAADVLHPPTQLVATVPRSCGQLGHQVDLAWTASTTPWVEHYEVLLSTTSGGPYEVVPPQGGQDPTATSRWVGGLARKQTYFVTVRSVRGSWWAPTAEVSVQTQNTKC